MGGYQMGKTKTTAAFNLKHALDEAGAAMRAATDGAEVMGALVRNLWLQDYEQELPARAQVTLPSAMKFLKDVVETLENEFAPVPHEDFLNVPGMGMGIYDALGARVYGWPGFEDIPKQIDRGLWFWVGYISNSKHAFAGGAVPSSTPRRAGCIDMWNQHRAWCEAIANGRGERHPWRDYAMAWVESHKLIVTAKEYTTAILPKWAGDVLEIKEGQIIDGMTIEKRDGGNEFYARQGQPRKQTELFEPPEQRLPLRATALQYAGKRVKGLPFVDYHGGVSNVLRIFHEVAAAAASPEVQEYHLRGGLNIKFDFDYFRRALYPDWAARVDAGQTVKFQTPLKERVLQAMASLINAYFEVSIPGVGKTAFPPILLRTTPSTISRGTDPVLFLVDIPWELRRGGLFITDTIRHLGFRQFKHGVQSKIRGSATKYQFYLALVQYWDNATDKGALPYPTRPKVERDSAGLILDAQGKPLLNARGKPETRWQKGNPVEDRHGVQVIEEHPEAARFYPEVSWQEIQAFMGQRLDKCRRILREMESDGVFKMKNGREGVHFFPSKEHLDAHYSRRKARKRHARKK